MICGNFDKDIIKCVVLFCFDFVYGVFKGIVVEDFENKVIIING